MTGGHIALIVIGIIGLAESTWGISSPGQLKAAVDKVAQDAPERSTSLALFFAGLAVVLWLLMSPDRHPSDWALLLVSWILAGGALVNLKRNGFHQLIGFLVLRRSPGAIRSMYLVEFCIAVGLIWLGVSEM